MLHKTGQQTMELIIALKRREHSNKDKVHKLHTQNAFELVRLVEFVYFIFTCMPSVSVVNVLVCMVAYDCLREVRFCASLL